MSGLFGDRHILVDHADPPFAGQRDRQRRLGNGVHGRGHDGDVERDIARKMRLDGDFARQHFRIGGHEQHVVERKSFGLHPFIDK